MPLRPSHLPDALVWLLPDRFEPVKELSLDPPVAPIVAQPEASTEMQTVQRFAEDS